VNISVGSMVYSKVRKNKRAHLKWNVAVSVAEAGPLIPARTVVVSSLCRNIYLLTNPASEVYIHTVHTLLTRAARQCSLHGGH
jgi:hypothetical protein